MSTPNKQNIIVLCEAFEVFDSYLVSWTGDQLGRYKEAVQKFCEDHEGYSNPGDSFDVICITDNIGHPMLVKKFEVNERSKYEVSVHASER